MRNAREREHIVTAIARAQAEWRELVPLVESAVDGDATRSALQAHFSPEQARAVVDMQILRVSQADRDRIAHELDELRREIEGLARPEGE